MTRRPMRPEPLRASILLVIIAVVLAACGQALPSGAPPGSSSASAAASGEAAPGASLVPLPSVELPGEVEAAAVLRHLEALAAIAEANGGVRTAGTPGYEASVEYVAAELRSYGLAVSTPEFTMATYRELPGGTLSVVGGATFAAGDDFRAMIYSTDSDLTAPVATVGYPDSPGGVGSRGCSSVDWEEFPEGAIALTPRAPCLRRDLVLLAQEAGAVALVVANEEWESGEALRPALLQPEDIEIPALAAIGDVGEALVEAAEDGVEVRVSVDTEIATAVVRNVIADLGDGDGPIAMLGAHLDGVHDGPGVNDNGSGAAAVMEIAHLLADAGGDEDYRFAFWAAEEFGLHGSRDYVMHLPAAENRRIAAYLNLDMLGSVNGLPIVYRDAGAAAGSSAISDFLVAWLTGRGIGAETEDLGGGTDHAWFADAGIPTGGIFSGATELKSEQQAERFGGESGEPMDPCYHRSCDTVENVDAQQVATFAQAAAVAAVLLARGELPGG